MDGKRGMEVNSYQDLSVWKKGLDLTEQCYRLTGTFPKEELFGLTSQIRRAAASVPGNIAEGWGRSGTSEYLQFLRVAQGSLKELETYLIVAQRVELLSPSSLGLALGLCTEIGKMLNALMTSLKRKRER